MSFATFFPAGVQADTFTADPGSAAAIPVTKSAAFVLTIAAGVAETNTLANPSFRGQRITIYAATVGGGGTRAITAAAAINQAGNTIMTFGAVADCIILEAVDIAATEGTLRWRPVYNDSVALS